jgi:hypothetical protein
VNAATRAFTGELAARPDVLGVLLFGSWARGDNRPDSDVDLVVIVRDGYRRCVEYCGDQAFELIFVTEAAAFDFWAANRDDAAALWAVAKIVHDTGVLQRLEQRTRALLAEGKLPLPAERIAGLRFDAEDQLRHVAAIADRDPATAAMLLAATVLGLTALVFDLRCLWTPPPKQRLAAIAALDPVLADAFRRFHTESALTRRLQLARELVAQVF